MSDKAHPISTPHAAKAIGPYSQGVRSGQFLFISGQIPLDPVTLELVSSDVISQTHRVLQNIGAILETAGGSFRDIVRTTVFLTDLQDFTAMNSVYATYFEESQPARSTVQVTALPKAANIEIDAIAILQQSPQNIGSNQLT